MTNYGDNMKPSRKPAVRKTPRIPIEYRTKLAEGVSFSRKELNGDEPFSISVNSEIGRLRKVFVHTPGREVELMTPKTASELLYNDILQVEQVHRGHAQLKGVLSLVADVYEVSDCLQEILENEQCRAELLQELVNLEKCPEVLPFLHDLESAQLTRALIEGVPLKRNSLERYLSAKSFSIFPLPNMYFMRDSSAVVGNCVIATAMASSVRMAESIIMRTIYKFHPIFRHQGFLFDGLHHSKQPEVSLEGGDILVANKNLFLFGISERTTSKAVDILVHTMIRQRQQQKIFEGFDVFAVLLPPERNTIHLDMIFTLLNREQVLVYAPYILNRERCRVVKIHVDSKGRTHFSEIDDLLLGLRSVGLRLEPILCGGDSPLHQQREQWNSAANMFAIAPGKVLSYDMHQHTVQACENAGFQIYTAVDVIKNPKLLDSKRPLVITLEGNELARGGGGPRCMTCPLQRDELL